MKIFTPLLFLLLAGAGYYLFVVPTIVVTGDNIAEILASFIRFNIPQFFLMVFFISLPIVWLLISIFEADDNN